MGRPKSLQTKNNYVQCPFSDAEYQLIVEACARAKVSVREMGRRLFLAWFVEGLGTPGSYRGGACGSARGCRDTPAVWWNTRGHIWLCAKCADNINEHLPGICVENGPPPTLSEEARLSLLIDLDTRAAPKTRSQLIEEMITAARAIAALDEAKVVSTNGEKRPLPPGFMNS
jgi:hypothetical protein